MTRKIFPDHFLGKFTRYNAKIALKIQNDILSNKFSVTSLRLNSDILMQPLAESCLAESRGLNLKADE